MPDLKLTIDGQEIIARPGMTILEAAQSACIHIPTLCHQKDLEPYGGCRLCSVEIRQGARKRVVASCVYPAEDKLVVFTESERIRRIRKVLIELLLTQAPGAKIVKDLAREYGANVNRFKKDATFCILCGMCVRYCNEVKKLGAVSFIGRGASREVTFMPEIAAKECSKCRECFRICPTNVIEGNFLLAQALDFNTEAPAHE
ncbi:MAG: 2Fe-2S iron-sulfur cluster-binding protein [Dehalogenimonas sp.]